MPCALEWSPPAPERTLSVPARPGQWPALPRRSCCTTPLRAKNTTQATPWYPVVSPLANGRNRLPRFYRIALQAASPLPSPSPFGCHPRRGSASVLAVVCSCRCLFLPLSVPAVVCSFRCSFPPLLVPAFAPLVVIPHKQPKSCQPSKLPKNEKSPTTTRLLDPRKYADLPPSIRYN
jgi:hypothetical protein